jgi:histone H3/H4
MSAASFDAIASTSKSASVKAKADSVHKKSSTKASSSSSSSAGKSKATSGKPALAIVTTGLKKSELPSAKHKHAKSARVLRYEQFPLSALSRPMLKRLAQAHGIRMLSADGYAALRAVVEENTLNVIVGAMTMTGTGGRHIVNEKDLKYALDLNRQ